jgi:hypothetical protein
MPTISRIIHSSIPKTTELAFCTIHTINRLIHSSITKATQLAVCTIHTISRLIHRSAANPTVAVYPKLSGQPTTFAGLPTTLLTTQSWLFIHSSQDNTHLCWLTHNPADNPVVAVYPQLSGQATTFAGLPTTLLTTQSCCLSTALRTTHIICWLTHNPADNPILLFIHSSQDNTHHLLAYPALLKDQLWLFIHSSRDNPYYLLGYPQNSALGTTHTICWITQSLANNRSVDVHPQP